ncbi:methylated-DNA--[protein]-cysteine S-methyltransferase [Gaoshiqia sp. Z1-71]|uniref:methylated-DNA--[protein]-cysteine S-methyltransferase n=1 Tax=Gaoshiqia hydrogeniformans TaxID=3290090 RepID=UPI003BF820C0
MTEKFTYFSPIGPLLIETENDEICYVSFRDKDTTTGGFNPELKEQIVEQLEDYFTGHRYEFDLPLCTHGTDFQKKVWEQLRSIPYGQFISYADLAIKLGDKNLVRAVGGANSKNPLAILVPCHRVVGRNNKLVGYAGGVWRKKWLIQHELSNKPGKTRLF